MKKATLKILWEAAKAVLRGKFIVTHTFCKKQEKNLKEPNLLPKTIRIKKNE